MILPGKKKKCNKNLYLSYLQVSSVRYSGLALSEVAPSGLSHDAISYWLKKTTLKPSEVWKTTQSIIQDRQGILIFDDTVLDKRRSECIELVNAQYSGNAHGIINGISMVNAIWHNIESGEYVPVDFRIYDKNSDNKTKNDHFREMLSLAVSRQLNVSTVVFDGWYSSLNNLKAVRDKGMIWVAGLKKNRKVNRNEVLGEIEISDEGQKVHLRGYGWVTVFKLVAKNGRIDYVGTNMETPSRCAVEKITKARWSVEVYHRELKQTCGIERCQSRTGRAQRNHICLAILAWINQHIKRCSSTITLYQQKWEIIKDAVAKQLKVLAPG